MRLREYLRVYPCRDIFAFWAEDNHRPTNYYECDACQARNAVTWYILLINEAAAVVEEKRSEAIFEFIAYHATRHPPKAPMPLHRNGARMFFDFCGG